VAVNLRPLEVYRALLGSGVNFPAGRVSGEGRWGLSGFFTLPITLLARNDSQAHESSFYTSKNVAKREQEMESYRAKADEIHTRNIFRQDFCP